MTLNLGILAHVDAGKTSLTERLLYAAGIIDEIGRVDHGTTRTDFLALERQRGITIKSAVASFVYDDTTIDLIDTPGHPDFIAEVERVLAVLDGVVLVISAVEGVQAQTRVLMRTLRRLELPTLLFVNKIDRRGARIADLPGAIAEKLTRGVIPLGRVVHPGGREADFVPYTAADADHVAGLIDLLSEHDESLLAAFVADETIPYLRLRRELAAQTQRSLVHPLLFGSAMTGAGVDALLGAIVELLPGAPGSADEPLSATVFKIERGRAGEKIAYVRVFAGTIRIRDRVSFGRDGAGKVTAIEVFERGATVERAAVEAGQIAKIRGLGGVRIGDAIGAARTSSARYFAEPTLQTVVFARRSADRAALHTALGQLAEQDPLIDLRQDDTRGELYLSLYGEVQKEVIGATLALDYGLDVDFRETTTICVERPVGTGAALEILGKPPNPFLATLGLRLAPAPIGSGIDLRLDADVRSMPLFIFRSVENFHSALADTLRETLCQGLFGWRVTDCSVVLTHSGYVSPSSSPADFRGLLPLVLMSALKRAGTVVCEPLHHFRLEIPADTIGSALAALARLRAVLHGQEMRGSASTLEGEIPADRIHALQRLLPGITRGEGVLESAFARFEPLGGSFPTQPRPPHHPLDRKAYLTHVLGWASAGTEG